MPKNKILFIVATQYENMGDLLINRCLVNQIAQFGDVYLDTKNVPLSFKQLLLEHPNTHELKEISPISLKGKGLLMLPFVRSFRFSHVFKSPGPFGGAKTIGDKFRYYLFFYIFSLLKSRGANAYLIGNDLIVRSPFDEMIFSKYAGVVNKIFVRSKKNREQLQALGLKNVGYSPDLCFLLEQKEDLPAKDQCDRVGISFRDLQDEKWNAVVLDAVKNFVSFSLEQGKQVDFFYQVERDYDYNKMLFGLFEGKEGIHFREQILIWEDRDYYASLYAVLSNRLHVVLLGQSYGAIPLALINGDSKTKKIRDIYESIDLAECVFGKVDKKDLTLIRQSEQALFAKVKKVNETQRHIFNDTMNEVFSGAKEIAPVSAEI